MFFFTSWPSWYLTPGNPPVFPSPIKPIGSCYHQPVVFCRAQFPPSPPQKEAHSTLYTKNLNRKFPSYQAETAGWRFQRCFSFSPRIFWGFMIQFNLRLFFRWVEAITYSCCPAGRKGRVSVLLMLGCTSFGSGTAGGICGNSYPSQREHHKEVDCLAGGRLLGEMVT